MQPAEGRSGGDGAAGPPPSGDEPVYASARTSVVRRRQLRGGPAVVIKQPRGAGAVDRLQHEWQILRRLAGVEGAVQLAEDAPVDGALHLHDCGSLSLSEIDTPLAPAAAVELGHALALIVAGMHRCGVIHRDINPTNIMVDSVTGRPTLIDFDAATTSAEERPGFSHAHHIVGTLTHLAPEQSGRTGWPLDQRADLYALGATLYDVVTGAPPFGTGEPLALLRAHLSVPPVPPADQGIPPILSDIILRLLEKEPDRRYQSALGLAHDLARLRDGLASGRAEAFPLGEQDYPLRLLPSGRPVGRDRDVKRLAARLNTAAMGRGGAVFVTGAAGVGKTTLIGELRPRVTAHDGWFVEGKFDQSRRDRGADGLWQAFRSLGRLLLGEPEAQLRTWRTRLRRAIGPNCGVVVAAVPELAVVLDTEAEPAGGRSGDAEARLVQGAVDLAVAVASSGHPLVIALDDLQWAGPTAIAFIDTLLTERHDHGVLVVGAFRDDEVDTLHPLAAMRSRWARLGVTPLAIRLANLPPADVGALLTDMLRLEPEAARELAEVVSERTGGNPFDTVELINALRRDDVLTLSGRGWRWDVAEVRRYVGGGDVVDLLTARIGRLPASTVDLLRVLASLGGELDLDVLAAASDSPTGSISERLDPALEDGLVVLDGGPDRMVRFRHDRVRQAVEATMPADVQTALHLSLARRLAPNPGLQALAAEQYLESVHTVTDVAEQQRAACLLRAAAAGARLTNPALAERLLAAAVVLPTTDDEHAGIEDEWHEILCGLVRLAEADEVYAVIEQREGVLSRSGPACAHIRSLCLRNRQPEALALGLELLGSLGFEVPPPDRLAEETGVGYAALRRWVDSDASVDAARPAVDDPVVLAAAAVIEEILPVAYFAGEPVFAWLVCEAQRLWETRGPCAALVAPLAHAGFMTIALHSDHRTGYEAVRRVLAVGEARGYEPQTSHARFLFSLGCGHWFEPVASNVEQALRAREGLQYHRDPSLRFAFFSSVPQLLDVAPSLAAFTAEVEAAMATAARLGDEHSAAAYVCYRQLARALRGETETPGSLTDESIDMPRHLASLHVNPTAGANAHTICAVAAAVFADTGALIEHGAAAMPLLPFITATYLTVTTHLVQALALAERARALPAGDERAAVLAELAAVEEWFVRRAEDCRDNFGYLLDVVRAERLRAEGETWEAALRFDAALGALADPPRPFHRALVTERAARFHLAAGARQMGRTLLAEALHQWFEWGATGKAAALAREYPGLEPPAGARELPHRSTRSFNVAGGNVDLLGVLQASRALSSVTSLDGLREQVAEVLGAMTGATVIRLLTWADIKDDALARGDGAQLPLSVVRYVRRTEQPLLVNDATRDARFARDRYFAGLDRCSLLAVPILSRGRPQALLLLEKPTSRAAFSVAWLESVTLVAGQLAVALENAAVYASLERKVAQRTSELATANERLETLSRTDPLTGLANRRRLEDILDREWERAEAGRRPVGIIMVDIDHFKAYNDRLGHQAGDECLRRVAKTLAHHVRASDVVARYGGEEFSIILPNCALDIAHRVAEGLRLAVSGLQEPHPAAPDGRVTISLGVASSVPSPDDKSEQLLGRADQALYEAKQAGRNRVADA